MKAARLSPLVVLLVCGCGHVAATPDTAFRAHGIEVRLPAGWQSASASLTPTLTDPRELMSVGTFPLRYRRLGCDHMPTSALADLGDGDAFVTIQERGHSAGADWAGFPPRPSHFGPEPRDGSEAPECVPGSPIRAHWLSFTDGARHFYALVAFGPHTTTTRQAEAWEILDSLAVDQHASPGWKAAG